MTTQTIDMYNKYYKMLFYKDTGIYPGFYTFDEKLKNKFVEWFNNLDETKLVKQMKKINKLKQKPRRHKGKGNLASREKLLKQQQLLEIGWIPHPFERPKNM